MSTKIQFEDGGFAIVNPRLGTLLMKRPEHGSGYGVAIALDTPGAMELAAALTEWVAANVGDESAEAERGISELAAMVAGKTSS